MRMTEMVGDPTANFLHYAAAPKRLCVPPHAWIALFCSLVYIAYLCSPWHDGDTWRFIEMRARTITGAGQFISDFTRNFIFQVAAAVFAASSYLRSIRRQSPAGRILSLAVAALAALEFWYAWSLDHHFVCAYYYLNL